jgi:DNA polymerase III alpha subunit (gram-positive type)
MSWFVVDVESDGPVPPIYSMVCFGCVKVDADLNTTFYGKTKPISEIWIPEVLAISGISREQHLLHDNPELVMKLFNEWIESNNTNGRPVMVSDNIAYDWQWINYYFHKYLKQNPFGFSGRRIADLICGLEKDLRFKWKDYRRTKHDHNPLNDSMANAEAFLYFINKHNLHL